MRHGPRIERLPARHGLTILELLAAVALASMLMVAVMGVLGLMAARRRILLEGASGASWEQEAVEQIQRDLAGARRYELATDRLRLVGYGGRYARTGQPTHRPTDVVYRLVATDEGNWLIREEIQRDGKSDAARQREIVCRGVTAITMDVAGQSDPRPRRSGALPECCHVAMIGAEDSPPVIELFFCR